MEQYKIIILGASGSGKTVYLASMYHKLLGQHDDIGFFLTLPPNQRKILIKKFGQITSGEWPRPTQRHDVSEWVFTCSVQNDDLASYDALNFRYLDYAGEKITEPSEEEGPYSDFDEVAASADGILAIIDGHKIFAELTNSVPPGGVSIYEDITNIIPMIQKKNKTTPVHFVITKWDLLEGDFNLRTVRQLLMDFPPFETFVKRRIRSKAHVRLIPISSVGMNFAELMPSGIMKKIDGALPKPYNVEMPLAFTLIDKFRSLMEQIIEEEKRIMRQAAPPPKQYTWWEAIKYSLSGVVRDIRDLLPSHYRYSDPIFHKLVDYLEADAKLIDVYNKGRAERFLQERDQSLINVKDEQSALEHVIDRFLTLANRLDAEHINSDLSKDFK